MKCPTCNTETGSSSSFCPNCGTVTGPAGVAAIAQPQQNGLSETAAGTIAYITIIPAIVFLAMEPYNRSSHVRFHAWQSICLGVSAIAVHLVLGLIPIVGWIAMPLVGLGFLVLWIMTIIKASKGERYKLPIIGNFAEKQAK